MPPQFKLASFIVMWVVAGAILLTMIGTGFLSTGGLGAWILAVIVAGGAASASSNLFEGDKPKQKPGIDVNINAGHSGHGKAKRGDDDLATMLALLDEDDAHELRQRIKQRLAERIDGATDEEVESFEQLLNTRERQKRR